MCALLALTACSPEGGGNSFQRKVRYLVDAERACAFDYHAYLAAGGVRVLEIDALRGGRMQAVGERIGEIHTLLSAADVSRCASRLRTDHDVLRSAYAELVVITESARADPAALVQRFPTDAELTAHLDQLNTRIDTARADLVTIFAAYDLDDANLDEVL